MWKVDGAGTGRRSSHNKGWGTMFLAAWKGTPVSGDFTRTHVATVNLHKPQPKLRSALRCWIAPSWRPLEIDGYRKDRDQTETTPEVSGFH